MGLLIVRTIALDEDSSLSQLSPFSDSSVARTEALASYRRHIGPCRKGGGEGGGGAG